MTVNFFFGLLFLSVTFNYVDVTEGHKILMVCAMPSRSHYTLCKGVTDTLADNGHDVTFISAFASDSKKFRDIPITDLVQTQDAHSLGFAMVNMSQIDLLKLLNNWQPRIINILFNDPKVINFLDDKSEKFDLVIFEYFMNEVLVGFGVRYKCPVIALSSMSLMSWLATMTSNPLSIATVPNLFTTYTTHMTLGQRVVNTLIALSQEILSIFLLQPTQKSLYEKYFPEESKLVPYSELKTHISMVVVNSHPSVGVARPLLPNTIEIGGYHIADPAPLPEDLQKTLDSAKHGVIYFSMGSILKSSEMDVNKKNAILKTFSTFKETILWKFEEDLPGKPKNVMIKKWMPQSSILAHPNVKLFISHGGLLSCTEATYFGVPLLAIPVFGDQYHNAKTINERSQGILLEYDNITESTFTWSLKEILGNPIYTNNAKRIKETYHDRPMKPRELLAFYANHVIRTNGAKHLSPPPLSRCSQLLLDVAFVILVPITILALLSIFICKKMCCGRKSKSASVKKTKQN